MNTESTGKSRVLYAAFKGMGDFICAAPAIKSELDRGSAVTVLIFPQVLPLINLLDFGVNGSTLRACVIPSSRGLVSMARFIRSISRLSPTSIYVSPHAPRIAASWKFPLLLWILKHRYWGGAKLFGADSEPLSGLFDIRIPVNRHLPYMLREWTAYTGYAGRPLPVSPPDISFKGSIARLRQLPHVYDLVIHPGAGTQNRKWPTPYYPALVEKLPSELKIAVVGLPADVAELRSALPVSRTIEFLSGSLEESIATIARARVALTMDSGSMFFASVLDVPSVTLFGPSNPLNVIPSAPTRTPLYDERWSCQPCRKPTCSQRQVYCMATLSPGNVRAAIMRLLDSYPKRY